MKRDEGAGLVPTLLLLLNILLSIGVAFLPDWTKSNFTTADQVILGISSFTALLLVQMLWSLVRIENHRRAEVGLWPVHEAIHETLHNIRTYMHQVAKDSYGPNDKFVNHFLNDLKRTEALLRDAAEKKELRVSSDHFVSVADVLGAFATDQDRIYRYTWPIEGAGPLFTIPAWRHFFELAAAMLRKREISRIKVLLIVEQWELLDEPNVRALMRFYSCTKNFECKAVLRRDFAVVAADNAVPPRLNDFGLYGDKLLYVTEADNAPETTGRFVKDNDAIRRYRALFEIVWSSQSLTKSNPPTGRDALTLDGLFEIDQVAHAAAQQKPAASAAGSA